jgi:cytochrome c oxidase assembly protein subunit 15
MTDTRVRSERALTRLHRFAVFVAGCTVVLLAAGGMVTSTDSGLAVPDWPNTYGHFMFSFPLDRMVGGILYEHGHRLIASLVGMLTIALAVWTWRVDARRWVRRLAVAAVAVVVLQGVLGGLTVLLLLPAPISVGHAALAQFFFCLTVSLALFTSRGWRAPPAPLPYDAGFARLTAVTTLLLYGQIILGATMRHREAGMAIPDFPLAFGRLIPPFWSIDIAVHFAHRIGALVATAMIVAIVLRTRRRGAAHAALARPALIMLVLVLVQGTLGAFVVLTGLQPIVNTAHLVNGALLLATAVVLALRSHWMPLTTGMGRRTTAGSLPTPIEARP